jgi:hypothetical protein
VTRGNDLGRSRLPLFVLIGFTLLVAAGCGSKQLSLDQKNERSVAASWLGGQRNAKVECRGNSCEIDVRDSFADAGQAWFLAVPVTTYQADAENPGVNQIVLKITDARRGEVATFRCSLLRESGARLLAARKTGVGDAHEMCKGSFAPTA